MMSSQLRSIFLHFILSSSFFSSNIYAFTSNETDRLALLAFKAKITYDPLGIMSLWNNSIPFCHWYGVTCSTLRQRVTRLDLISLQLGGSISPHVGNLSFLHVLQLVNNTFIGHIPPEIGRLRRLQVLNLANSTLGGEIPRNLSSCSKLKGLVLSDNKLEGEIPWELGLLSKLQIFWLHRTNLTGALPSSLGNLTSIKELDFTYNNFVGEIPKTLGGLYHLKILSIAANHFHGEVPHSLFNITSMIHLDVGVNYLLGGHLPPGLFHTLPNLQYLSVLMNQFTGSIPASLSNASHLQSLQLSSNSLTGKVPSLEKLNNLRVFAILTNQLGDGAGSQDDLNFICSLTNATALEYLYISYNNFGGMLPECIANLSSKLIRLSIQSNFISGIIPHDIDNLIGLAHLCIQNNSFSGKIPSTIGNLKNLASLCLGENNLSGFIPPSLGMLSKLIHLDLSSNRLEGTIPSSLGNCSYLEDLYLDENRLHGSIPPQVLTIPSLSIALGLSYNRLTGPLPDEVGKLTHLNFLDVSSNMLSGKIPDSLGEMTSMEQLDLHGNRFQGLIPSSLSSMKGIRMLDLSSNNLSGQIPGFLGLFNDLIMLNLSFNDLQGVVPTTGVFANATATSLEGNNNLCGGLPDFHLPKCSISHERKRSKLSIKTKATIAAVAGLVGVSLLLLFIHLSLSKLRSKHKQNRMEAAVSSSENPPLQFVSYGDLHRATNGFSEGNLVGMGSFGHVYRGILGEEGQVVAIKVLNLNQHGATKSFAAECKALRNIRHRNLVKLTTVCSGVDYQGNEFKALIYEFMPNGSLQDWLDQPTIGEDEVCGVQDPERKLGLLDRINIAMEVSSLLEYLHHGFGTPLVHCDIKPSNILLDGNLSAHVSDFGLSKFLSNIGIIHNSIHPWSSIGVIGSIGYAPPEYGLGSDASTQGDVYSYGILLLEMFTGKRPTDEMFKDGVSLHLHAKMALSSGVVDILDPSLKNMLESEDSVLNPRRSMRVMECVAEVIEIGVSCSNESPSERMEMRAVTTRLHKIRDTFLKGRSRKKSKDAKSNNFKA